jgi:eukaryotic translation initiation factor 2C
MAAPPAFYAQKLTHRALVYLAKGSDTVSASSSGSAAAPGGGPKQLPEIKNELKGSMFYC